MVKTEPLEIPDLLLILPTKIGDRRGFFSETYNKRDLADAGLREEFVQDNHSYSLSAGVVRGLHFQTAPCAQGKLVRVSRGAIFDVAVDLRKSSATFGQYVSTELSAENWRQLWIPVGFAHGFCTLSPDSEVIYKTTANYASEYDTGIAWDDSDIGIDWPVEHQDAILSAKDRKLSSLQKFPRELLFT